MKRLKKLADLFHKLTCELFSAGARQFQLRQDNVQVSVFSRVRRLNGIVYDIQITVNKGLEVFREIRMIYVDKVVQDIGRCQGWNRSQPDLRDEGLETWKGGGCHQQLDLG
jgi:hypothetical protein